MTKHFAGLFQEVYATDVSRAMVDHCRIRLKRFRNVHCQETNGVDFHGFTDGFFDLAFSAFVYQHVPDDSIIQNNLADVFRVLKPGGVFKFQTNGVSNPTYLQTAKDTWGGASFPEEKVRALARRLQAQMISIVGGETQYCWTIWRKPLSAATPRPKQSPRIEYQTVYPGAEDIYRGFEPVHCELLASGLDPDRVDANSVSVVVQDRFIQPFYVGPVRKEIAEQAAHVRAQVSALRQIVCSIPPDIPRGNSRIYLRLENGERSPEIPLQLPPLKKEQPRIVLMTNGVDGGTDIFSRGPKSKVRVYLSGLPSGMDTNTVQVIVGGHAVRPDQIAFIPGNGFYLVQFNLPAGISAASVPLRLEMEQAQFTEGSIEFSPSGGWFQPLARRMVRRWRRIVGEP
jgi:SAM-dependent methyltransferase